MPQKAPKITANFTLNFLQQSSGDVVELSHCEFNLITIDDANGSAEITTYQGKFR